MTNLILPGWGVAVLVTLVLAVLGAAWGVASRASRSADRLDAATTRLVELEKRIERIGIIETVMAVAQEKIAVLQAEMLLLRELKHAIPSHITRLDAAIRHLEDGLARVDRASSPGHRQ